MLASVTMCKDDIKIGKLVIWALLHYRVMGDVYVEYGVVFRWFWALLQFHSMYRMHELPLLTGLRPKPTTYEFTMIFHTS